MSIVTRTGDDGTTGLLKSRRVSKASLRMHAIGNTDELNAVIGVVLTDQSVSEQIRAHLQTVQRHLFLVGAHLADGTAKADHLAEATKFVEGWISAFEQALPALKKFILPTGSRSAAVLHLARTVCRRAERSIVALAESEKVPPQVLAYINRLSDFLFLAARMENKRAGEEEQLVS
ncbi:TPA: cob(I)yrinic acid a,c-diamide adenosyltransferase [Candidatus Peribacteria bacterium]|nr:MAG: ATP:cob(I)alamin adenosyltransferase [Candidatus Peribacteria bacterium RIFOXYC2_FULL_58_10]OGJ84327.1 MAG: ATP:cob(I)alamin adenosyltransferase [Candidatus Peribacteria bacterium RIFOXYD2_FULL_58_15]HAI98164.1 cob(I)yrinic acid a,c-diamide adenosyltransferase [Candidatus Peribacteria bacterium]HAS34555.1 cob(I)yrinic acid a,c-diamide adenosyltransferase [Candidatus Peribacteria bacterium]